MASYKISPPIAFAVGVAGIAVFSGMDAVMKTLTIAIGAWNAMFWRNCVGIVVSGLPYAASRPTRPSRRAITLHVTRGAVTAVMGVLFFWGLARVPMAQAIALSFIAPLIAIFLAAAVLGEHVSRAAIWASVIAFVGVLTILFGQAHADMGEQAFLGALAVLGSAVCYAGNLILMRQQSQVAGPVEVAFWQTMMVTILLGVAAPWLAAWPAAEQWPLLAFGAVLATASLLLLSWAYAHGEASYLAPTEYTAFIWAALLGWAVFGETVSPWTLLGATLIIIGCAVAIRSRPQPLSEPVA